MCKMPRKLWPLLAASAFIFFALFLQTRVQAQTNAPRRDWKIYPAIVEIDTREDILALGDVHGDYERLLTVLVAAKIIPGDPGSPEKVKWQAGKAVLVCTGDFINKWNQSLQVIALLRSLQAAAARAGGHFVVTLGNHEADFLAGSLGKKTADFVNDLQRQGLKPKDVIAGNDKAGIGAWLRSLPAAARVNDWFFAHAGNTHGRTLAQLREDLQDGIDKQGFAATVLQDPDSLLQARMHPQPWWEAEGDTGLQSKEKLARCVQALGVRHLVIGHQPSKVHFADKSVRNNGELSQHYDGLIFLIDTGMSRGVGYSNGSVLRIHNTGKTVQAFRVSASGEAAVIWSGTSAAGGKRN
jgi:diadenosine tetraphosphatase ApaH/serine/threonine PP2A family protein phosphatase